MGGYVVVLGGEGGWGAFQGVWLGFNPLVDTSGRLADNSPIEWWNRETGMDDRELEARRANTSAILKEYEVRTIRKLYKEGKTQGELARAYMVSLNTIARIVRWETWTWVKEEVELGPITEEDKVKIAESQKRLLERLKDDGEKPSVMDAYFEGGREGVLERFMDDVNKKKGLNDEVEGFIKPNEEKKNE